MDLRTFCIFTSFLTVLDIHLGLSQNLTFYENPNH